ncbi:hypothetical protein BDV96DRAFT_649424 [Lophiotrema nucula]|uniref:Uncharacterized protein n=1 Tax=Lophiotrema nucula TaxID=690887 RepID=A0A6A5YY38_9PLEO|nr:hypothetical protein BDV96DRAFT_649424 [Lophiotrema nucula]
MSKLYIERRKKYIKQHNKSVKQHRKCYKIALEAVDLDIDQETEDEWMLFYRKYFFVRAENSSRAAFREVNGPRKWTVHQNLHWDACAGFRSVDASRDTRTSPKPDLTYAFPITREGTKKKAKDNFSLQNLGQLRWADGIGLTASPTKRLDKWSPFSSPQHWCAANLVCYPWAVVEAKRSRFDAKQGPEIFCYC